MSEEKQPLIIFIDDIRNPEQFLGSECPVDIVWIKNYPDAVDYLLENQATITEVHLDQYLGDDPMHLGSNLLELIRMHLDFDHKFKEVKKIYLHSSDSSIIDDLIEIHGDFFKSQNVELIDNHYSGY